MANSADDWFHSARTTELAALASGGSEPIPDAASSLEGSNGIQSWRLVGNAIPLNGCLGKFHLLHECT
ncbi:hypothetical protein [Leisingera sp.]|uniref:hypothetical protein n=1 Tax=Leisingera sp. TaxID=1879318 RepID=UPI002B2761B0|nr:hypothetical protein [Leisingera sp.]